MSNDQAYQGAADPGSLATDYNTSDFQIQQALMQISTATPVLIMTAPYDANGNPITPGSAAKIGYVDVKPMVNQIDGYGQAQPHDTVNRLSYHRYQSGYGAFIADPKVGDIGYSVAADRDTSVVRSTDKPANPGSNRTFDKADGVYFGCNQAGPPVQWFAWLTKGFHIEDAFGNTIIGTAAGVKINGALINLVGDVITKRGVDLDNHTHPQGNDSHGDAEVPTDSPTPGPPP